MITNEYKGYCGHAEYDEEANLFHGEILGIHDVITFQSKTIEELEPAFRDSVEDYLEFCAELHREPEKPFSGRITISLTPELHQKADAAAHDAGKSLNGWLNDLVGKAILQR